MLSALKRGTVFLRVKSTSLSATGTGYAGGEDSAVAAG